MTMRVWSVGENTPGYLPESDPDVLATWAEARDRVRELAQEWNDENAEHGERCEHAGDCDHCGNAGLIGSVLAEAPEGEAIDVRLDIAGVDFRVFFAYPINEELTGKEVEPDEPCEHGLSAWLCEGPSHYPLHM